MIWNDDVSKANCGSTKDALWQRLQGSLDLMFQGVDEQGRELVDGYRGCLIRHRWRPGILPVLVGLQRFIIKLPMSSVPPTQRRTAGLAKQCQLAPKYLPHQ